MTPEPVFREPMPKHYGERLPNGLRTRFDPETYAESRALSRDQGVSATWTRLRHS